MQIKSIGYHYAGSAIFKTFPTDAGMCCSFNINAADKIFNAGMYTSVIDELQMYDINR